MPCQIWQQPSELNFQLPLERQPDKFGPRAQSNQKVRGGLGSEFFRDGVKRARDRNLR
jgi:protein-serine/threonine kinase